MNPKVSILVPIYNVSKYIVRCSESLFNQTFTDIEYIFVNDSTPDDSIEKLHSVLEKYPNRKSNVKIIHHIENKGLACARNTALDAASGEYIAVVDSDDYIEPDMIAKLYERAITTDADIVISDYYIENKTYTAYTDNPMPTKKDEQLRDLLLGKTTYTMWAKLYKSSLYKNPECRVPDGLNYHEDIHVMFRMFFFAGKVEKLQNAYYHYITYNFNAISRSKNESYFQNSLQFWEEMTKFLKSKNSFEKFKKIIDYQKIKNKARLVIDCQTVELRKKYADMFSDVEKSQVTKLKKGERLMLWLVRNKLLFLTGLFRKILVIKQKLN